ncbi:MAG: hypothetical protein K0U52_08265 [Gammaproteobacteria bacterium]|nr:hypothetical protein [Gammaproteobacteria bacterium]
MNKRWFLLGYAGGVLTGYWGVCQVEQQSIMNTNKTRDQVKLLQQDNQALTAFLQSQQDVIHGLKLKTRCSGEFKSQQNAQNTQAPNLPIWDTHHKWIPSTFKPSPTIIK